jgi:hypothetical protein
MSGTERLIKPSLMPSMLNTLRAEAGKKLTQRLGNAIPTGTKICMVLDRSIFEEGKSLPLFLLFFISFVLLFGIVYK